MSCWQFCSANPEGSGWGWVQTSAAVYIAKTYQAIAQRCIALPYQHFTHWLEGSLYKH